MCWVPGSSSVVQTSEDKTIRYIPTYRELLLFRQKMLYQSEALKITVLVHVDVVAGCGTAGRGR